MSKNNLVIRTKKTKKIVSKRSHFKFLAFYVPKYLKTLKLSEVLAILSFILFLSGPATKKELFLSEEYDILDAHYNVHFFISLLQSFFFY